MNIKLEIHADEDEKNGICSFCLSVQRRTQRLDEALSASYSDCWDRSADAAVCWECVAIMKKFHRFQMQALEAHRLLTCGTLLTIPTKCLSTLGWSTRTEYDRFYYHDVTSEGAIIPEADIKEEDDSFEVFVEPLDDAVLHNPDVNLPQLEVKPEFDVKLGVEVSTKINNKKASEKKKKSKVKHKAKVGAKKEKAITPRAQEKPDHYECYHCGRKYKRRLQIFKHMQIHFPSHLCETCGKSFSSESNLKTHHLMHGPLEARPYGCTICSRRFITRDKLTTHMIYHNGVKSYECDICNRKFWLEADVKRHKKLRHGADRDTVALKYVRSKSQFKNMPLYKDQAKSVPKISPVQKRSYTFNNDATYPCTICGRVFTKKMGLKTHAVTHTNERPYKCDLCPLTFKFAAGLWGHKVIHTGLKPHECTVCGARFTLRSNLSGHMKIHTNDKPFECEICNKRFPWKRNVRNHMKVHMK